MTNAIYFKWLQRQNKFRNPDSILRKPDFFEISKYQKEEIQKYLDGLTAQKISYTYPSHPDYPMAFYLMKEPPLFLEYIGQPIWNQHPMIAVVGSRKCHSLTRHWIQTELFQFLKDSKMTVVSGGAQGVDQLAHLIAIKAQLPTVVVLPTGLNEIFPSDLKDLKNAILHQNGCFISEFETDQKVRKSFFYLRNRLIAAMGKFCLIVQAGQKSGTMLTVHHALEFGRPVLTLPAHPLMVDFSGNVKLVQDGAYVIYKSNDLHVFWLAESWSGPAFEKRASTDRARIFNPALQLVLPTEQVQ